MQPQRRRATLARNVTRRRLHMSIAAKAFVPVGAITAGTAAARPIAGLLREPGADVGRHTRGGATALPGDELLENADLVTTRAITVDAPPYCRVAVARADGPGARRRLHVRLDREPARPRHAQRRPHPSRVAGRGGRGRRLDRGERLPGMRVEILEARSTPTSRDPRTARGCGRSCSSTATAAHAS